MSAVGIAVVVAVACAVAVGGVKSAGRWLSKVMRREFADAVESVTAPKFRALDAKFDEVQRQNRTDHGTVVARLEDVERRLADVESAVAALTQREE